VTKVLGINSTSNAIEIAQGEAEWYYYLLFYKCYWSRIQRLHILSLVNNIPASLHVLLHR